MTQQVANCAAADKFLVVSVVQSLSALKESDIGVLVVDVARLLDPPSSSTVSGVIAWVLCVAFMWSGRTAQNSARRCGSA